MNEVISNFHFLRPHWLLLILPSVVLGALLWRRRGREQSWARVIAPELLPHLISSESVRRSRAGVPALVAAWILATLAAAGPSWEQLPQPVMQKQDALVLVMDLSYSMLATDLQPSRQDRVRRKLLDLLRERREGLTALIAYAGDAHIVAPLTDDNPTIANLLPALNPGMMPLPGSNPVEAIERAEELLDSAGVRRGRILLVTDGISASDAGEIRSRLEGGERRLAILGVGTEVGAPIALPGGGFLKDSGGEIVVPALDEDTLEQLASDLDGRYERMSVDDADLSRILSDNRVLDEDDTISLDRRADRWQDMAHWLVLPLLLVALASFRRGWLYLLPFFLLLPPQEVLAFEWRDLWLRKDQQGQQALEAGDTENAAALFSDPRWRGAAAYEGEDYELAAQSFASDDSADGWYNRGNALAGQGRYDEAIAAYEKSLELKPDQEDARRNIETIRRLQEQQQQQQPQQGDAEEQAEPEQNSDAQDQQQQQQNGDQQQDQQSQQQSQSQASQDGNDQNGQPQDPQRNEQQDSSSRQQQDEDPGSLGDEDQSEQPGGQPMPRPDIDNSAMQEDIERDQAMKQWLRRVPDDPSGLLREKFRFESRQRQQQGKTRATDKIW
ncbi:MAG: VWA domain-containing protein [Halieaceae bacterium]|nr:VWA domain-containing protein [Halieaceae bacterium]